MNSGVLTLLVMMKLIRYDGQAVHANQFPSGWITAYYSGSGATAQDLHYFP
ncbi:hypothetical protein [Paenibacillus sp. FSL R7-277]|uniref:hypothetical protein n=1 Tax=Paenibacillus sp. FSL R7-277 TaxID=1227352 RepID=UPI0004AE8764|nr:hypothetical protein [Paenibacillus sp. FSL R7-277]